MTHATRAVKSHDLLVEGINSGSHNTFLTTQGHGGLTGWGISSMPGSPPRQHKHERWYTQFTHTFITTRRMWKYDYDGQMIFGDLAGIKASWHLSYKWRKTPKKKPHPGNLSRPGIEPGPAACQARMLPPAPQRWTCSNISLFENLVYRRREKFYPRSGLEPGPLAFRANVLTNWAIQDMYRTTIELISWAIFSHLRTDILLLLLCPMEACILKL